jgi:hypothetical protein
VINPEFSNTSDLACPGALMTGITLLATVLFELHRQGEVLAELEHDKQMRLRARANRETAAIAAGRPLGRPGRPRKVS